LVTIPVRLYSAVESERTVHFRLLDRATSKPIKEIRVDPETGKEVPWDEIVHGVERAKGKFVALTNEELRALPLPSTSTIALTGFVHLRDIDPRYYVQPYYLGPDKGGERAYALLREVLEAEERAGIGKLALRTREHLVAVRATPDALVLHTLHYASELRSESEIPKLPSRIALHPNERKMARQLVDGMAAEFAPGEYHDDYAAALRALVDAKQAGTEPKAPSRAPAGKVVDLQAALRASLKQGRSAATARRRRAAG
jgi:DNA end-binding protein Ku